MHAFKSKHEEQICSVRSEKNGKKEKTLQSLRGQLEIQYSGKMFKNSRLNQIKDPYSIMQ